MTRRTRLCLSLLLVLMACFALLPAQALAAGDFDTPRELEVLSMSPAPVESEQGPQTPDIYVLAGTDNFIPSGWNIGQDSPVMTEGDDGIYSCTVENVEAVENAQYQFKVVQLPGSDYSWSIWHGLDGGDQNVAFSLSETCDVTVTYDPDTEEITVSGDGVIEPSTQLSAIYAVGSGKNGFLYDVSWNLAAEANLMTEVADGVYQITYYGIDTDETDPYEFKFAANGGWAVNWGIGSGDVYNVNEADDVSDEDLIYNAGSIFFSLEHCKDDYVDVTLELDLSQWDADTRTGAKFSISVGSEPATEQPTELPSEEPQTGAYYLVGTMNDWQPDDKYRLSAVNGTDGEYAIYGVALTTDSQFKVVKVEGGEGTWYPDGMDNNYVITADGTYNVYFRPDGAGGEDWFYNCIYVAGPLEEPLEEPSEEPSELPATVVTAPAANTLTYSGQAQTLVTAGTATGGTMQYALGTATEATQTYTPSIPTAINAGTYYVWYKVVGDENHKDTEPQLLTVKIYPLFAGYSLTLNGDIGVNFYLKLTEEQAEHASVAFKWMKNNTEKTETVNVSKTDNGYMVTCRVSASEIRTDITAHLVIDDGQGGTLEETTIYSVYRYADVILKDPEFADSYSNDQERLKKLQALANAMLAYGDNAKAYFDANAVAVEPAPTATIPEYTAYTNNLPDGVSFEGATLSLRSKTTLSLYFTNTGGTDDVQLTMDNKTENVDYEVLHSGNEYVIRIRDIPAAELADNFTVKVNGTGAVTYSPLTYCYKAQTSANAKLVNTVRALYNYWVAANAYFRG